MNVLRPWRAFARFTFIFLITAPSLRAQAFSGSAAAAADILVFINGDKLTGKLVRIDGGNLTFHSDMTGDLKVPLNKIKELNSGTEFVALSAGKPGQDQKAGTGAVALRGDTLTLTQGAAQSTLPVGNLAYLIDMASYDREIAHSPNWRQGWAGAVTGGFTLVRSTQSATTFTGALNLTRQVPTVDYLPKRHRFLVNVTESYGTDSTPIIPQTEPASPAITVKTNIFHADAERDQYFSPRFFALGDLGFDHNFAQGLQFQQIYGVGAGWTALQDSRQELDLKGDLHYERQQFTEAAGNQSLIGSTFQENYQRTLPLKLAFTEWANILPAWNNTHAYSANAYLGLALPVFKRLSVSLSSTDNYLNDPAPGFRKNSVQFVTGVSYTLK